MGEVFDEALQKVDQVNKAYTTMILDIVLCIILINVFNEVSSIDSEFDALKKILQRFWKIRCC